MRFTLNLDALPVSAQVATAVTFSAAWLEGLRMALATLEMPDGTLMAPTLLDARLLPALSALLLLGAPALLAGTMSVAAQPHPTRVASLNLDAYPRRRWRRCVCGKRAHRPGLCCRSVRGGRRGAHRVLAACFGSRACAGHAARRGGGRVGRTAAVAAQGRPRRWPPHG